MSRQAIRGLLQARLATAGWASQTAWENVSFAPTTNTPYQEVTTEFAEPDAFTLADASHLRGVFQVRLMYPIGGGTGAAEIRAEAIAALFPRNLVLSSGAAKVKIARQAHITGGGVEGERSVMLVRLRFSDR